MEVCPDFRRRRDWASEECCRALAQPCLTRVTFRDINAPARRRQLEAGTGHVHPRHGDVGHTARLQDQSDAGAAARLHQGRDEEAGARPAPALPRQDQVRDGQRPDPLL